MAEFTIKTDDLKSLAGKVIIVTGGSSGIGLTTVELLLSLGASVVCGDIKAPERDVEGAYTFIRTDVAIWKELLLLFRTTKRIHGHIDHVFVNAGVGPRTDYLSTQIDENGDAVEPSSQLFDVSLKGAVNTSALAIFYLRQQEDGGSIVITGAAKHAVLGFGRGLVARLGAAQLPIRVNTLAPSWTESNILPSLKSLLDEISVKVQPASVVARCAAYLMADPSRNGQVIHIQHGIYTKIDETFLLPTYRRINRDCITEDEALERLEEAEVYRMVRVQPQLVRFAASKF
ncbi:hypothetical protein FOQG_14995 [Fusarium oxysporum f. sp. raphani 54005]|uniref:Short-chain dehydrogenase/reductase ATR7 n=1 Tax=Fusarium oxysporum f. sp. raphani 54005 TaxID=1089458 RepID=X0BFB1_FUSOX|nr:hypothetical protein FOQG_14995 [Fusarium oxysporum f. sp. raphani 54005]KAI8397235.1 hypothetical protein FOFC_20507 [Fusarium oxysporum]